MEGILLFNQTQDRGSEKVDIRQVVPEVPVFIRLYLKLHDGSEQENKTE
jgi:hypothetical protein